MANVHTPQERTAGPIGTNGNLWERQKIQNLAAGGMIAGGAIVVAVLRGPRPPPPHATRSNTTTAVVDSRLWNTRPAKLSARILRAFHPRCYSRPLAFLVAPPARDIRSQSGYRRRRGFG